MYYSKFWNAYYTVNATEYYPVYTASWKLIINIYKVELEIGPKCLIWKMGDTALLHWIYIVTWVSTNLQYDECTLASERHTLLPSITHICVA